ncbi:hypothetical protein V1522DRAFT_397377 [Lipomyces starkeyi]
MKLTTIIATVKQKSKFLVLNIFICRRLAYPNRLYDLVRHFGRSRSAMTELIWTTALQIYNIFKHLLYWDDVRLNENFLRIYADAIHRKGAALDNCFRFIDGTVRPICRPTLHKREEFQPTQNALPGASPRSQSAPSHAVQSVRYLQEYRCSGFEKYPCTASLLLSTRPSYRHVKTGTAFHPYR